MKKARPSSALQRNPASNDTTFNNKTIKTLPLHQNLFSVTKPALIMSRSQIDTATQQKNPSKTSHPCLINEKSLLSEKELTSKLQQCLTADFEMVQAQLNFHLSAEKIKSQEQKKLLLENYEDSKKLLHELAQEKFEILKTQHKDTIKELRSQHERQIEETTRFYERKIDELNSRLEQQASKHAKELSQKCKEIDKITKEFESQAQRVKEAQEQEEDFLRRLRREIEGVNADAKEREMKLKEEFEKKLNFTFENMHREYEEQMACYELEKSELQEKNQALAIEIKLLRENLCGFQKKKLILTSDKETSTEKPEKEQFCRFPSENIAAAEGKKSYCERGTNTQSGDFREINQNLCEECECEKVLRSWDAELRHIITNLCCVLEEKNAIIKQIRQENEEFKAFLTKHGPCLAFDAIKNIIN